MPDFPNRNLEKFGFVILTYQMYHCCCCKMCEELVGDQITVAYEELGLDRFAGGPRFRSKFRFDLMDDRWHL